MTVFDTVFSLALLFAGAWIVWQSTLLIDERNKLRRYTGKYYDFDIDQALKSMDKTRSQALSEIDQRDSIFDKSKVKYFDGDNT
jgi:hypothetical protein